MSRADQSERLMGASTPLGSVADVFVIGNGAWLGEELSNNSVGLTVRQSPGLFLPTAITDGELFLDEALWWMNCQFAARLLDLVPRDEPHHLTLASPGPRWTDSVPVELLGRAVRTVALGELELALFPPEGLFVKLAEAKHDSFPAAWRTVDSYGRDVAEADLPSDTQLQLTTTRLDLAVEYRCYILNGAVLTHSLYLRTDTDGRQVTYYDDAPADAGEARDALDFADAAVREIGAGQPPAYVLDVGYDRTQQRWVVIEGNPAWSSAWYGCDVDAVLATIAASQGHRLTDQQRVDVRWLWTPDAVYVREAERLGRLR